MRRTLDSLLAAPGLTRNRFLALAVLSCVATAIVIAAALRGDPSPYGLLAAAYSRPAPHVHVAGDRVFAPPAPAAVASGGDAPVDSNPSSTAPATDGAPVTAADTGGFPSAPLQTPASSSPTPAPVPVAPKPASKIKHVFVVYAGGSDHDATWGQGSQATYLNGTLKPQGSLLGGYRALSGGDLATLIALTSGQKSTPQIDAGCTTYATQGCIFDVQTLSFADQLTSKGLRWHAYVEDMGNGPDAAKSCRHPDPDAPDDTAQGRPGDEYATRHNPFVYYRSLTDLGDCATNDLPLDGLSADLADAKATPNFSFIAPNLCNGGWETPCADGSPGGLATEDAFLAKWVPQILDSPAYKADGLLVVLTPTGALFVSQFLPANAADQSEVDAYSLLHYFEDLFGLDYLGDAATANPPMLAVPRAASAARSRH